MTNINFVELKKAQEYLDISRAKQRAILASKDWKEYKEAVQKAIIAYNISNAGDLSHSLKAFDYDYILDFNEFLDEIEHTLDNSW